MARPAAARASARAAPQATGATSQGQLPLQLPFCWQQLTPLSATPPGTLCCEEPERALVLISLKAARAVLARAGCCHVPAPRSPSTRLPLAVVWAAGPAVAASLTAPLLARLGGWGLHLEPIGERRFLICGVPAAFAQADAVSVVDALFACGIVGAAFAANDEPQAVPPLSPHAAQAWAGAIGDAGGWPEQRGEPISSWAPTLLAALDQAAVRPERVALTLGADHPALVANVAPPRERQNHPQNLANIP